MSTAERIRQRAMAEGRAEGEAKGHAEGRAELLIRQLGLRFGPVPEAFERRIRSGRIEELDAWGERVLTAASLEDVFA